MLLDLNRIGQIALAVGDVDHAEAFYGGKFGLRKLYRFNNLSFFDCAGVRLMLEKKSARTRRYRTKFGDLFPVCGHRPDCP